MSGRIFSYPFGFKVWSILRNVQRYPFGYNKLHLEPKGSIGLYQVVIDPVTGESITNILKLLNDPILTDMVIQIGKEFGNLAKGDNATNTPGMNSMYVLTREQIAHIP